MSYIQQNIIHIRDRIHQVCQRSGRDPAEVQLIAVTKTIDAFRINEALSYGITDIGENKVQEIMTKYDIVDPVQWHMIGHLQTNKVKYIIDKVKMVHSLDRVSLAEEIHKRAMQHNKIMDVLIQVNVAEEDTKFGLNVWEVENFISSIEHLNHIKIKGLMTVAPFEDDPENVRIYFKQLRKLFEDIKTKNYTHVEMKYLSMGMTNDFEVAIEEGANVVRVGTAIFGKRDYAK